MMNHFGGQSQTEPRNVGMAVLAGFGVAIVSALVWGVIAYTIKYEFSILAILVGFAVGTVMSRLGRVRTPAFGIASAALAVFGCALGSLIAEILVINREGAPLSLILAHLGDVLRVYPRGVGLLGFLFGVFAALYGYRAAIGNPIRWGWGRRMRPPMNQQPYGTMNQPYAPGQQPYGTPQGQPYGAPGQAPAAPGQPYGAAQPSDPQRYGTPPAQPADATQPMFGFKQPPPGTGPAQP
jgi:hypothetical protein